jgi:FkbM family methyltransferase
MSKLTKLIHQCKRVITLPDSVEVLRSRSRESDEQLAQISNLIGGIEWQLSRLDSATVPPSPDTSDLRFYGQFGPPVDCFIFDRYFPDRSIRGICVESGAFDGVTESSCKFFEETMGWQSYNIEPMPNAFERLIANRPKSKNYNFAFSDRCGTATFRQVSHPELGLHFGNSSLSHTELHLKDLRDRGCQFDEIEVPTITWREWVAQEKIPFVDLLVLDVEGHELQVIEGMVASPVLPDIICVEIGHLDFGRIRQGLAGRGYVYDVTSHVNAYFIRADRLSLYALRAAQRRH